MALGRMALGRNFPGRGRFGTLLSHPALLLATGNRGLGRDRRAPLMMLVHEECRITCDHRHSLWYLTCSSDCGLSRNAIQQWSVHDFVPMTAAPGNRGKRKPELSGETRTLHFDSSLSHGR